MERFKISPKPSRFAKKYVRTHVHSGLELELPLPMPSKPRIQSPTPAEGSEFEIVFEHYLDEHGRWISN